MARVTELTLEAAKPALHEAVLPRTKFVTTAELYFHSLAEEPVFVAEVLATLVTVQNSGTIVLAQRIKQRFMGELTGVADSYSNKNSPFRTDFIWRATVHSVATSFAEGYELSTA